MNGRTYIRNVDELGRVVLPAEIRREVGLNENVEVEISADMTKEAIIIKKRTEGIIRL